MDLAKRSLVINSLPYPLSTVQRMQKYIKKGYTICNGGLLEIALNLVEGEGPGNYSKAEVTIKDTGVGIPANELTKIFEPFYTTRNGGMGLGLAVAKKIFEQHGGNISVESEPNVGSAFIVLLPLGVSIHNQEKTAS